MNVCIPYSISQTCPSDNMEDMIFNLVLQIFSVLLWPFFIINTPECCMNLTEQDRVAFSGRCSQQPQEAQQTSITMQPKE